MRNIILLLAAAFHTVNAAAQGCSDAGVCTAGPIGAIAATADSSEADELNHFARLSYSYAIGEQGVVIIQVQPEISLGLVKKLSLQVKLPYISAKGNLGSNSGVGDLITTLNYLVVKERDRNLTVVTGVRLPTGRFKPESINHATYGPDAHPLPMPYQLGLGTTDLLLGVQYRHKRWTGALAYQHILKQNNQSTFQHRFWQGVPEAQGYFESFGLERANDAVARIQYAFPINRLVLQPGLLAIYHLSTDSRLEETGLGGSVGQTTLERREIHGSDGLTLNLTADARYAFSKTWALEASMGTPMVTRQVRPDGLTRALVLSLGLRWSF